MWAESSAKEIAAQRPRDGVTAGMFQERGGQGEIVGAE